MAEIRDILRDVPVRFVSLREAGLPPAPEEEGLERHDTFVRNALAKAEHFHARSGLPTVADDSGLCVDALGGGPGVRTKRFAPEEAAARWGRDEANNRWLLEHLRGIPPERRGAHYRCAVAAIGDGEPYVAEGRVDGRIALEPRGEGGFGYDPLFLLPEHGRTYAELPQRVKRRTSHRAEALRRLRPWLLSLREAGGRGKQRGV